MIEAAQLADLEALAAIENRTNSTPWSIQQLHDSLENHSVYVMREKGAREGPNNSVSAFLVAQEVAGEATLLQIAVDKPCQQQGYGRQLLVFWLEQLSDNISQVWLEVRESNHRAQKLYQSCGFQMISERKNYYRVADSKQKETARIFCLNRSV